MFGDTTAMIASRAVASATSKKDKNQLLTFISQIPVNGDGFNEEAAMQRRQQLVTQITLDKNGMSESVALKKELKDLSEDWLQAVTKCDIEISEKMFREASSKHIIESLKNKTIS